jgi:uncharacterized protein YjiS (DUF1127 family)
MTDFAVGTTFNRRGADILSRVLHTLWVWNQRRLARNELASLSERTLHDIGLSRSMIEAEIDKPFWRA